MSSLVLKSLIFHRLEGGDKLLRQDTNLLLSLEEIPALQAKKALLIDLRSPQDFASFHIPGFINRPFYQIATWLATINPHQPVYFICPHGQTAYDIAYALTTEGYQAYAFIGGIEYYQFLQKKMETPYF